MNKLVKSYVSICATHPRVQKAIVNYFFSCFEYRSTPDSAVWIYLEREKFPIKIEKMMFGNEESDEEEDEGKSICYTEGGTKALINAVRKNLLQTLKISRKK